MYEMGEISKTVQMSSVLVARTFLIDLLYCSCGVCLRPSPEQKQRIKTQFEVMTVPCYLVRVDYSRGAKLAKAKEAKKESKKTQSTLHWIRWVTDATCRASQTKIGWTREYCRYLDHTTTDISNCATWKQRNRHENGFVLGANDGPHPGPMGERDGIPKTTRRLAAQQREQGRVKTKTQREKESAKKTFQWQTASRPGMAQPQLEIPPVAGSILVFNRVVRVSKMARTTPRRMAQPTSPHTLLDVRDSFPSFGSTPPPTQTSLPNTGIKMNSSAAPRGGMLFGRLVEQSLLTGTLQSVWFCSSGGDWWPQRPVTIPMQMAMPRRYHSSGNQFERFRGFWN